MLTAEIHDFVDAQYRCWNEHLLPELSQHGIRLLTWEQLSDEAREMAQAYFLREVDPLLTPITIDPAHPFPRVLNRALCLASLLRAKRRSSGPAVLGVLTVPRALPRFVRLADSQGSWDYMLLQDLIAENLTSMYRGYEVLAKAAFRVTRNSNLYFEEEESRSLLESIRSELHNRRKGGVGQVYSSLQQAAVSCSQRVSRCLQSLFRGQQVCSGRPIFRIHPCLQKGN